MAGVRELLRQRLLRRFQPRVSKGTQMHKKLRQTFGLAAATICFLGASSQTVAQTAYTPPSPPSCSGITDPVDRVVCNATVNAYNGCRTTGTTFAAFDSCVQSRVATQTDQCRNVSRNNAQTFDACVAKMKAVKVPPPQSK